MIRALAFDFGGTLFSTAKMGAFTSPMVEAFVEKVTDNLKCSPEQAEAIFSKYTEAWKARRARADDLPEREINSADLLQAALSGFGIKLENHQMIEILNSFHSKESEEFTPLDKVVESLPVLAQSGYRLSIVSNNPWSESIRVSLRRHKIEAYFEHVITSCDVGFRKPHPKIFDELVGRLDLLPSEILFVGDSYTHDIETPKKMGLKTCLVDFEGVNKNRQSEHIEDADFFLTEFDKLILLRPHW